MSITAPPCPEYSTVTEPFDVEGEEVWRCPTPVCGRRTYGIGEIDIEATAELAAQDGLDDEDDWDGDDQADAPGSGEPAPPAPEPVARALRLGDLAGEPDGVWVPSCGNERGWRHLADAAYDQDAGDTIMKLTYSDGEVEEGRPAPMALMVRAGEDQVPTATFPGPTEMVKR